MKLIDKVEQILKEFPFTRNCDKSLSIELWKKYYPHFVKGGKISFEKFFYLPCIKDIARHRAILQNKLGKYPCTSLEIAKNRSMKQIRLSKEYAA